MLVRAWRPRVRRREVTFMGDLRANRWRYAATALSVAIYFGLEALGADLWIAVLIPVLFATGLGFLFGRHR